MILVEDVGGHDEGILQTMRDQQGTGVVNVPLLDQEFDDGGRSDRIKTASGRIVEKNFRLGNDGPRNSDAAAHAPENSLGNNSKVCSSSTKRSASSTR